ncbi:monovalent cation/H(+) antiporter subunit G [soil metagenome]|jgi:multicomponent Na+:H+ antiporter subunit G
MENIAALLGALAPWLADVLVILGVFGMTVGVYGIVRMPDIYNKLHAASKVVFLGVLSLLVASMATNDAEIILRVVLIGAFLVLTTPVSAHVVGRAAFLKGQKMESPNSVDESGRGLDGHDAGARATDD